VQFRIHRVTCLSRSTRALVTSGQLRLAPINGFAHSWPGLRDCRDREASTPADQEVLQPHRAGIALSAAGPNFADGRLWNQP
jgi:hypothetical protein